MVDPQSIRTPIKKFKREKVVYLTPDSPIETIKTIRNNIQSKLRDTTRNFIRKNLMKDYDVQMRETEKWINARFEMIIQKNHFTPPKTPNISKSKVKLSLIRSEKKDGWRSKRRNLKSSLKQARSVTPFISKFI
mmetsp:Transcript_23931/g.26562  ORF Transcript_23931/g.26562 Transcript_23931/m.26562 type:complete len:134 (-) Transcript_23931:47-448(-)